MQWMAFVHPHGGPQCHSAKSFKAKHFQCQPFLAALSLDCRMSLCGGFRVCAAGVVIYDTVGLQKVCTGGASCSQSRLLCMHHYISLARKSPCGYMCLGNFWTDFRFCSQHSFGLTVSTCVAYWCLGCLRQISCPDACTPTSGHALLYFCDLLRARMRTFNRISAPIVAQYKIRDVLPGQRCWSEVPSRQICAWHLVCACLICLF